MKQKISVFVILVIFILLVLSGVGCVSRIAVQPTDYVNKDELRSRLLALSDECASLAEELDALLARYARAARMNMAIIHDKREMAILAQAKNKKHLVGPMIDFPIPRSELNVHELNKKLKKARENSLVLIPENHLINYPVPRLIERYLTENKIIKS